MPSWDQGRSVSGHEHSGGYTPDEARRVAGTMLPDVLPYDPTRPAVYPTNGRLLTDSVVEYFMPLFSNGKVKTDNTRAHDDLLSEFPYVGPPHNSGRMPEQRAVD